jgi:uncharacterized protein YceK
MSRRILLVLVFAAVLAGGCGTLENVKRPTFPPAKKPDAPVCRVYGGVRMDWATMTDYDWSHTASYLDYVLVPILAVIDLALDVGGDTVTLPYTVIAEARRATRRPGADEPPVDPAATPIAPGLPAPGAPPPAGTPPLLGAPVSGKVNPAQNSTPAPSAAGAPGR